LTFTRKSGIIVVLIKKRMSANSNTDKKVGRLKAGTWGRTSGGNKPKTAKIKKRWGSKGARRVAKDSIRKEF
jgi:hypothetical protein